MDRPLFFNPALSTVVLDGSPVEGLVSDSDSIRVTPAAEGTSLAKSLNGAVTTFSNDESGTLELDLLGTSPTLNQINALWRAQKGYGARLFDCQVLTSANEPIRLEGCSIADVGAIATGGTSAAPRTVVVNVQRIKLPE
jgi:hypothetical protein